MSRAANGTYTAPTNSWNSAVEGTTIDESDWNETLADVVDALTDSVSRTGKGTVSAHIDFDENASPGTPSSNVGRLYASDVGGATSLMFKDAAGNTYNLLLSSPGLAFSFDTSTDTASDPGNGDLRFNSSTYSSVTEIAIDDLDAIGNNVETFLQALEANTYIFFSKRSGAGIAVYQLVSASNESGFTKLTVSYVDHDGSFAATDPLSLSFGPAGVEGAPGLEWQGAWLTATAYAANDGVSNDGASYICKLPHTSGASTEPGTGASWSTYWDVLAAAGTGDVVGPGSATDNAVARFDGTGGKTLQASSVIIDDSNNASGIVNLSQTGYHDLTEISAPSSPSANVARVYAVDSQSKTVPFWKDSAGVASALDIRSGWVQMYRTSDAGADPSANPATWVVRAPDGSYVSTSGTTSQGFAEALTYCATNGYNLFVNGGGGINSSDIDVATIHITAAIDWPPMFKQAVIARGVTFNFGGSATYGFKLDSIMMGLVDLRSCQIVCGTSTYDTVVWLRPRTANAVDPAIAITASSLLFGSLVHGKASSVGLLIDPDEGPIIDGNFIEVHEPNGTGTAGSDQGGYGVRILDDATNPVSGNTFRILDSHGHGTASVAIGSSTTNGAMVNSNVFDIHCDPDTGAIGLDLYGTDNIITLRVNNNEGSPATGLNIRSRGLRYVIKAGILEAPTAISAAAAGCTNRIEHAGTRYGGYQYVGTLSSISTVSGAGSSVAARNQIHSTAGDSAYAAFRYSNDTAGPRLILSKSRGTSVGSFTVAQNGDTLAEIVGAGADGTDFEPAASIRIDVDGTPGAGDMPGKIVFSTTADGAEAVTDRFIINAAGKLLAGVASAQTMANSGTVNPTFQLFGASSAASFGVIRETTPGGGGAIFALGSSRSTPSTGSYSALQSGDGLGQLLGVGDIGSSLHGAGAHIRMSADGIWSASDAPGRIEFATTPTGSVGGSTERMRIDSKGNVVINTAAISTSATDGFLYVPSCAGTPTGTPTTHSGMVPIVVNTSANKLYFYSGGAWRDAGP